MNKIVVPQPRVARFLSVIFLITSVFVIAANAKTNSPAAVATEKLSAVNVHDAHSTCPLGKPPGWLNDATSTIQPQVTELSTMHREEGTGVFRMTIDPTGGQVTKVMTVKSTGFRALDDSATEALHRWRWKPGTWKEADVQIFFKKGSKMGEFLPSSKG